MSGTAAHCVSILLLGLFSEAHGTLRREAPAVVGAVGDATTGTVEQVAGALPRVPEAPLPGVAGPNVPIVGSSATHTADPAVCGILGGIIVLNWIIACCCAGAGAAGGAAAGAEAVEGDASKAG